MSGKDSLPGFSRKREMLISEQTSKESLSAQGREFVARGLLDEALNFFLKAHDREGIEKVLQESGRRGDTFTFEAAARALGRAPSREEWEDLGEKALESGQLAFAYRAFEKADSQSSLEKVRQSMAERGIPPPS